MKKSFFFVNEKEKWTNILYVYHASSFRLAGMVWHEIEFLKGSRYDNVQEFS